MSRTMIISSWSAPLTTVTTSWGSRSMPSKTSSYMSATRRGVSTTPGRWGSSPIPSRIRRTPCSMRSRSKAMATSAARLRGRVAVDLGPERPHEREVPVALVVVEAVADHEHGGDLEPLILDVDRDPLHLRLLQQRAHLEAGRLARAQVLQQIVERQARVHDVLDEQHVAAGDLVVEVLQDAHHAARLRRGAV